MMVSTKLENGTSCKQKIFLYVGLILLGALLYGMGSYMTAAQSILESELSVVPYDYLAWIEKFRQYDRLIFVPLFMLLAYAYIPQKSHLSIFMALGILLVLRNLYITPEGFPFAFLISYFLMYFWQAMVLIVFTQLCNQVISFKAALWFYPLLICFYGLADFAFIFLFPDTGESPSFLFHGAVFGFLCLSYALYQGLLKWGITREENTILAHLKVPIISKDKTDTVITEPVFWALFLFVFFVGFFGILTNNLYKYLMVLQANGEENVYIQMMENWSQQIGIIQMIIPVVLIIMCPLLGWVRTLFASILLMLGGMGGAFYLLSISNFSDQISTFLMVFAVMQSLWGPLLIVLSTSLFILFGPHMRLKGFMFFSLYGYTAAAAFISFMGADKLGLELQPMIDAPDSHEILLSKFIFMTALLILMCLPAYFMTREVRNRSIAAL